MPKLIHLRPNSATPTLTKNYEGQNQARLTPLKIAEGFACSQSSYTTGPRRYSFDFTTTKQTEANTRTRRRRADYFNHCHVADIAPTIIVATETWTPQPPSTTSPACRCRAPKRSPQEGRTTPRRRHRPIIRSRVSLGEAEMAGSVRRGATTNQLCLQEGHDGHSRRHRWSQHKAETGSSPKLSHHLVAQHPAPTPASLPTITTTPARR